jgi:hypothetical protein
MRHGVMEAVFRKFCNFLLRAVTETETLKSLELPGPFRVEFRDK